MIRSARAGVADIASYQAFWLGSYFILNLVLTLYNKILLVSFPYPYTLTAVHAIFGLVGGTCLQLQNVYQPKSLWGSDYVLLLAFSLLYSINIAVSNASLDLVTVPFHQVVRATTPFFTTVLSWQLINARFNRYQLSSMFLVILGVCLATYGDYYFTAWGLILTLFGTVLASLKTLATHEIQTTSIVARPIKAHRSLYCFRTPFGAATISLAPLPRFRRHHLQLHPLDLLTRLSRLAAVQCVVYAYFFGEMDDVRQWSSRPNAVRQIILLSGNGIIACALNIVSFEANRRSGALAMGVAANVKQALTVICAVWFFHLTITPLNALGIALTLLGGGWYTVIECNTKYGSLRN
ncbi:TPT-domain-containing protein [Lactarius sanguifluus]|nr:TPT-domain-containing protein [Lactarius sanguifluus]